MAGCGASDDPNAIGSQYDNEKAGDYPARIVRAKFARTQEISVPRKMLISVRNTGDETIPALAITMNMPGRGSILPFAYHDRQKGLALTQRPVWVLALNYPKLAGKKGPGGTYTSNRLTRNFGPLDPGMTANTVWKVTPARPGNYLLKYTVAAGLTGEAKAVGPGGKAPTGIFRARIINRPKLSRVNDRGQVVPLGESEKKVDQGGG